MNRLPELNVISFASDELKQELNERLATLPAEQQNFTSFAYTDYGGDFFDRVCSQYFQEKYPENTISESTDYFGENTIIFGNIAKEFIECMESYLLGFEDLEDYYYEKQYECENDGFLSFIEDEYREHSQETKDSILSLLLENKSGHFSCLSSGQLDFCTSDLMKYVESEINIPELN